MRITGTALDDLLAGTIRRDIIDGRAGNDVMAGGLDHDTYYVDSVLDDVIEAIGEGTHWVYSTITYTLPDNVEHLRALGTANIDLFGNIQDNTLIGNRGSNILNGGAGADVMMGGAGNDTYVINIFSQTGKNTQKGQVDVIVDSAGIDTVVATLGVLTDVYYIMQPGLENLSFTSATTNMTITGNASKNIIFTGDADDTIDGGRGADTMDGGLGKNTFFIDNKFDVIIDNNDDYDAVTAEPIDDAADTAIIRTANYAFASGTKIEYITFAERGTTQVTGSDSKNIITGNAYANSIYGAGGDDTLFGGGGADQLWGGTGEDTFAFTTDVYVDVTKKPLAVRVMDFNPAEGDVLDISDIISYEDGAAISNYIEITDRGRDSMVRVNVGGEDGDKWVHVATLVGINGLTGEQGLFLTGNIRVEAESA